jgi:hypothetical protein
MGGQTDLGWALVHPTLTSREYMPVEVVRRGRRYTFVRTRRGDVWRVNTRGLWDGFATEDAAYSELQKMRDGVNAMLSERQKGGAE